MVKKVQELLKQFYITHRQQAIRFFKTLGKVRWTGEAGIKSYLGNIIELLLHHLSCFIQPELPQQKIGRVAGKCNGFTIQL